MSKPLRFLHPSYTASFLLQRAKSPERPEECGDDNSWGESARDGSIGDVLPSGRVGPDLRHQEARSLDLDETRSLPYTDIYTEYILLTQYCIVIHYISLQIHHDYVTSIFEQHRNFHIHNPY